MARQNVELLAFNRGLISPLGIARVDLERVRLMAEHSVNWLPRTLGPMSLRPGLEYIGRTSTDSYARYIPFVFATDDTALLEFTPSLVRFWVDDALVTRVAVTTATTNGTFTSNITGWTDADEAGCTSEWVSPGYMSLTGAGTLAAIRHQEVTVAAGDLNKEHAVRISVLKGECYIRIGSSAGGDEYVAETFLYPGLHSLAFTPTGNFHVRVFSREEYPTHIDYISVESSGVLALPTSWTTAAQIDKMRFDQSADVVFIAAHGVRNARIERRGATSWSVAEYTVDDGPFLPINTTPITMTASALTGSITLTASSAYFKSTNVGSLMKITSVGQNVLESVTAQNMWSDPILVSGVFSERAITVIITNVWSATVTLQRSVGAIGDWVDVKTYTANATESFNDGLDNQIIYYRIGVATGDFTSGQADLRLSYASGSITGWARITGFTSATVVSADVLKAIGSVSATELWHEGAWSARRGYPSAVSIHEGRLWWVWADKIGGSISDAYINFDEDYEGDAAPIIRSIGQGPVDVLRWLKTGPRLIIGGQSAEWVARSSSLDEPLTTSNFNLKPAGTRGSADVDAVVVDSDILFVDRSGVRALSLEVDANGGYQPRELSTIVPEVLYPGVVRIAAQRQPDTRVHYVLSDGTVAVLVYDKAEEVRCWVKIETTGDVEDVVVLPGLLEDDVYYVVKRTINGATVRTLEKMAKWSECEGGTLNKQADGFVAFTGTTPSSLVGTTVVTGLGHLEGEDVVVWAEGADRGIFTVASGQITIDVAATNIVVGLGYQARWRSTKLAYAAQGGSALVQPKRVDHIGVVLANTHAQGLRYGPDFTNMDELPLREAGADVDPDYIWTAYDKPSFEFNGIYDTDARVCLEANAPKPCTLLGLVISMTTHEKM